MKSKQDGLATRMIKGAIRVYQKMREGRPSPCRYVPSCSVYAYEAVTLHGAAKGSYLAMRRVLRCNPFGKSGYDPVPSRRGEKVLEQEFEKGC